MNTRILKTLYKKEIMDVLRDKKTIITMIVVPLILYPILFIVAMQVVIMVSQKQEETSYTYSIVNATAPVDLTDKENEESKKLMKKFFNSDIPVVTSSIASDLNVWIYGDEDNMDYVLKQDNRYKSTRELKEALEDEELDAYVVTLETDNQNFYYIFYLSAVTNSANCMQYLKEELEGLNTNVLEKAVKAQGYDAEIALNPVVSTAFDQSSSESSMGNLLGNIIPFLLIVSVLMGCMYPAIDTTTGEKERGTLETLLTLPVNNFELIMSKFLSVATIAIASVLVNLIAVGGIAVYLYMTIKSFSNALGTFNINTFIPALFFAILCMFAFALFMSAVVMCICAFAKSFKEANNYTTPIMLVVMLTAYIGFIPNVELDLKLAFMPVVNVVLLLKSLLAFKYNLNLIIIVLISNILYALIEIYFLSKIYNSESVLFGESFSGVKLFEKRKNIKKGSIPSITESIFVYLVVMILMVFVGGMAGTKNLMMSVFVPQILILLLPIFECIYIKSDLKKVFRIKAPKPVHILAALFIFVGSFAATQLIGIVLGSFFPEATKNSEAGVELIIKDLPFFAGVLVIALLPAICEELFFRGYMLTAFKEKLKVIPCCIIVGTFFSVLHLSMIKLIPIIVLGTFLCYAAYKSESIFVSSLIHFLNNFVSVFLLYNPKEMEKINKLVGAGPVAILVIAIIMVVTLTVGIYLLKIGRKKEVKIENHN